MLRPPHDSPQGLPMVHPSRAADVQHPELLLSSKYHTGLEAASDANSVSSPPQL